MHVTLLQLSAWVFVSAFCVRPNNMPVCTMLNGVTYLLFLSFLGNVALLQTHSSEEVSEVAKQGDNAKAQVC